MKQGFTTWAPPVFISLLLHLTVVLVYLHQPQRPVPSRPDALLVQMRTISAKPSAPSISNPKPKPEPKVEPVKSAEPDPAPVPQAVAATPQPAPAPVTAPVDAVATANTAAQPDIQPLSKLTRPPAFLNKIDPVYPANEQRSGSQAYVLAEITLDSDGKLLEVKILKSAGSQFDEAVKEAIRKSAFQPGYIESRPVVVRVQIPFRFRLK